MQKLYVFSLKARLILQILSTYVSEGLSTSQIEGPYLIPINPVDGILSSAGSSAAGFGPEQAVDYILPIRRRTYWNPQGLPSGYSNYFIVFDFKAIYLVTKLHIINFGDNEHDVTAFKLESSSDTLNWTDVGRFFCQPGTHTKQKFGDFAGLNRYWRFTITDTIHGRQPWLVEVGFYGARIGFPPVDFDIDSEDTFNIGNSKDAQDREKSIERSLQRVVYKYARTRTPAVFRDSKDRGKSLKEPIDKSKHSNIRTTTTKEPLDDTIDEVIDVFMDSKNRGRSLKEPTDKSKDSNIRATTTEEPLDDVTDDVIDEVIDDTISVITTEIVPMVGTTKIVSHMHVSSLDSETDSFEDFFKIFGISHDTDQESEKMSNNRNHIEKGTSTKATKYMTWLYFTLGLVLLGLALVIMGCIILQLIRRQNKLMSTIEFNKRPSTCSISLSHQRHSDQDMAVVKHRSQSDVHKDIHKDTSL